VRNLQRRRIFSESILARLSPEGCWKLAGDNIPGKSSQNVIAPRQGRGRIAQMSSTHLSLHVHVIFGTKHQRPFIAPEWRSRFHAFLGGVAKTLEVVPEAVGEVADHVHLLLGLRATHRLADVMRDLKRASSAWVHETIGDKAFEWQDGYGAFTVSALLLETVKGYISRQEKPHHKKTFQEEYLELLKLSSVEFDGRYLW
jgi:REP element-mobilizing transposase RayT